MFKKLKCKFVIVNMLMISIVMLVSFAAIYLITFNNIEKQNKLKIENVSSTTLRYMEMFENNSMINAYYPSAEYIQAFGVVVNEQGEYIFDSSFGAISNELLVDAVKRVREQNRDSGTIVLDNKLFLYSFSQATAKVEMVPRNSGRTPEVEQLFQVSFLDVTQSEHTLKQLLITFVVIGVITLLAILGVSIYFAKRAVVPIEETYKKQRQFIQDASHELKTPLASISANLDAITANPKETVESQQKWLGFISGEIERMTKLVSELLYLAESDYTNFPINVAPINLSEVLEDAIASIEAVIFEKGIGFHLQIEQGIISMGDKDKIDQVIKILLDNALKYTNTQERIDVLLGIHKNDAILTISNTGVGIDKEHIDHIFDRFYRVDTSRKHDGGYGLGLAIAKSLVDSMNGEISVTSVPNVQTTFTVKLDRA